MSRKLRFLLILALFQVSCDENGKSSSNTNNSNIYGTIFGMIITSDDNALVVGSQNNNDSLRYDALLVKASSDGQSIWTQRYGITNDEWARAVVEVSDGYVMAGYSENDLAQDGNMLLLKMDKSGNELWFKNFVIAHLEDIQSIILTEDGGFLISGYSNSSTAHIFVAKASIVGDTLWTKTMGTSGDLGPQSLKKLSTTGYVLTGSTNRNGKYEAYVLKIDENANELLFRTYGVVNLGIFSRDIVQLSDGGFVLVGKISGVGFGSDAYVLRLNSNCDSVWATQFGEGEGATLQVASSVLITTAGDIMITGASQDSVGAFTELYLAKLNSNGNKLWTKSYTGGDNVNFGVNYEGVSIRPYLLQYLVVGNSTNTVSQIPLIRINGEGEIQ